MIFNQKSGFTLLEVLVTMTLLTLGLLGVTNLTIGIIKGNSYSKNVTSATIVAQQQIDQAQRIGYTNVNSVAGTSTVAMGGTSFTRATTVTNSSPAANMKTVAVSVSWNPGNYSVNLSTTLSQ
ncbi:MAG TPA: prepilin-type N-terminal cleavage/methylation domain-containing protein [Candidatus Binatia bacterium]|jgi:prepilin-type N-terminal cleavage/methylation domain-containing protein